MLTLISFVIVCIFFYSSLRSGVRRTVPLDWLSVTLEVIITIAIGLAVGFDKYLRTYGANPFDQSLPPNKYLWEGMPAAHTMFPKLVAALYVSCVVHIISVSMLIKVFYFLRVFQILLVGWSGAILCCRRRSAASQCHHEVYEQQQQQQQQEFNMDGMASGFHDSTPSLLKEAATDTKPIDVYQVQLPNEPPPAYYPDDKPPREPKLAKG